MPISRGVHWALLVMDKSKLVTYVLDSLSNKNTNFSNAVLGKVMDWMDAISPEIGCKEGWRYDRTSYTSLQQHPERKYEGGVFACLNAHMAARQRPCSFTIPPGATLNAVLLRFEVQWAFISGDIAFDVLKEKEEDKEEEAEMRKICTGRRWHISS